MESPIRKCRYCIRHKNGYCIMLKQNKADNDTCKLFEGYQASTTSLSHNKVAKSKCSIDWDRFLADTACTMLPSFSQDQDETAADKAISYARTLTIKLKETLNQGY